MKLTISQALKILSLQSPFSMVELKAAYRSAALKAHPDCGGKAELFMQVDTAYDFLKSCAKDSKEITTSYWQDYWQSRLDKLEEEFKKAWQEAFKTAKQEKNGMWFSTCVERFARAYMRPKTEWFEGVLFKDSTTKTKNSYREFLLEIAPNKRLREEWALKYYRLEFGWDTPYIFCLPPSKEVANV